MKIQSLILLLVSVLICQGADYGWPIKLGVAEQFQIKDELIFQLEPHINLSKIKGLLISGQQIYEDSQTAQITISAEHSGLELFKGAFESSSEAHMIKFLNREELKSIRKEDEEKDYLKYNLIIKIRNENLDGKNNAGKGVLLITSLVSDDKEIKDYNGQYYPIKLNIQQGINDNERLESFAQGIAVIHKNDKTDKNWIWQEYRYYGVSTGRVNSYQFLNFLPQSSSPNINYVIMVDQYDQYRKHFAHPEAYSYPKFSESQLASCSSQQGQQYKDPQVIALPNCDDKIEKECMYTISILACFPPDEKFIRNSFYLQIFDYQQFEELANDVPGEQDAISPKNNDLFLYYKLNTQGSKVFDFLIKPSDSKEKLQLYEKMKVKFAKKTKENKFQEVGSINAALGYFNYMKPDDYMYAFVYGYPAKKNLGFIKQYYTSELFGVSDTYNDFKTFDITNRRNVYLAIYLSSTNGYKYANITYKDDTSDVDHFKGASYYYSICKALDSNCKQSSVKKSLKLKTNQNVYGFDIEDFDDFLQAAKGYYLLIRIQFPNPIKAQLSWKANIQEVKVSAKTEVDDEDDSTWKIVLAVIGSIVGIGLIVLGVYYHRRKKAQQEDHYNKMEYTINNNEEADQQQDMED